MYGPMWPFLLTYGSHDVRLIGFRRLTVVNGTPEKWGVIGLLKSTSRHTLKDKSFATSSFLLYELLQLIKALTTC